MQARRRRGHGKGPRETAFAAVMGPAHTESKEGDLRECSGMLRESEQDHKLLDRRGVQCVSLPLHRIV